MRTLILTAAAIALAAPAAAQSIDPAVKARIDRILKATPLIDGHNDIAEQLAESHQSSISTSPPAPPPGPITR